MVDVPDVYDAEQEQAALALLLFPRYEKVLAAMHGLVRSAFPELDSLEGLDVDEAAVRRMLALAAERVVLIDEATQRALREVIREGEARGYTPEQIADGVPEDGYGGVAALYQTTWRSRATTIARHEIAEAQVAAALDRYGATGLVNRVRLVEHIDTDEPCASRNGRVVPLSERPRLLHPGCRLVLQPVVNQEGA